MNQDIKNNESQGRTKYVPASVKVINVTAQRIICQSENTINNLNLREDDSDNWN